MENYSKHEHSHLSRANQCPGTPVNASHRTEDLLENAYWGNAAHKAEPLDDETQGPVYRHTYVNPVQSSTSSSRNELFDQNSRHLGAQFHPNNSSNSDISESTAFRAPLPSAPRESSSYDTVPTGTTISRIQSPGLRYPPWDLYSTRRAINRGESRPRDEEGPYVSEDQNPCIIVSDPHGLTMAPVFDHLRSLRLGNDSTDSTTPQNLIVRLDQIVHDLNKRWMEKLAFVHDLYGYCSRLPTRLLFIQGIQTMQDCFDGLLPITFEGMFAFMHVAFACALVIDGERDPYYWVDFCSDIDQWQNALSTLEDLDRFARVRHQVWYPQTSGWVRATTGNAPYTSLVGASFLPDVSCETSAITHDALMLDGGHGLINRSYVANPQQDLWHRLNKGTIFKACAGFLNTFGLTQMAERNSAFPAPHSACGTADLDLAILGARVMEPLQQDPALAHFNRHVTDTQHRLHTGLILTAHEFELTLTSCTNWPDVHQQAHHRFVEHVNSLCDMAMGNPYWRNSYYVGHVNTLLVLSGSLEEHRQSTSGMPPQGPAAINLPFSYLSGSTSRVPDPPHYTAGGSSSLLSGNTHTFHHMDTTLPTSSSPTYPTSMRTNPSTFSTLAGDFMSIDNRSPSESSSLASSDITGEVTFCDFCPDKEFHGTLQSRRRSLRRHMEAEHSLEPRLSCPVDGCDKTFKPGRSDNVKRHVKKHHQ